MAACTMPFMMINYTYSLMCETATVVTVSLRIGGRLESAQLVRRISPPPVLPIWPVPMA